MSCTKACKNVGLHVVILKDAYHKLNHFDLLDLHVVSRLWQQGAHSVCAVLQEGSLFQ